MALNVDQITAQNFKDFYGQIRPYLNGTAHGGFTPIGTVISVMGKQAPLNYLVCDGTVYNIADYPELAAYFTGQFEASNFFGGDGVTTFAVPDLRGEFLRGSGTNSHTNQGNGDAVGVHQDGTEHPFFGHNNNNAINVTTNGRSIEPSKYDNTINATTNYFQASMASKTGWSKYEVFTSRPTNTSVLYCIATKNIFMDAGHNYSTDEQVVGTWIDGKPLYQKVVQIPVSAFTSATPSSGGYCNPYVNHNISNIGVVVNLFGQAYGNVIRPLPFSYGANTPDFKYFASLGSSATSVFIECGTEFRQSVITKNTYGAYVIIQYTKTTD